MSARSAAPPNFIFILADDLGYADLGCYGGRDAAFGPVSPRLDEMATTGLRFTNGYANSAVCSPTRFALMTGRYQYRLRGAAEEPLTRRSGKNPELIGLPPEHPTLPSLLRAAGYRTGLMGKWHLGYPPNFGPLKSGYDEFFGPISGAVDYHSHLSFDGRHDLWDGDAPANAQGYLTDLISERACGFIARHARQPFFMSVHYTAPHWPWETRDDTAESRRIGSSIHHVDGGSLPVYQRMIHHMDEGIGRILQTLHEQGIDDNTLVIFTSDNGGERFADTWPFTGKKMDLLEGGLRVPLIARWPAQIRPRRPNPPADDDDGLDGHAAGCRGCAGALRLSTRWPEHAAGVAQARCAACPADVLAHEVPRPGRRDRRCVEVPEAGRARVPVQHRRRCARAREPRGARA